MCNLYSITTNQAAIIALFRVVNRYVGNLAPMPGVFPDYKAPVVRNGAEGRELATARWGMPSSQHALMEATKKRTAKLEAKGKPVDFKELLRMEPDGGTTNIRNVKSKHWSRWLGAENRCVVPFNSFSEFNKAEDGDIWFALERPVPSPASPASGPIGRRSGRSRKARPPTTSTRMIRVDRWLPSDNLKLEPNALVAATEIDRNLVLTAGPGAGKTEMLAQRADFLLRTGACRYPRRILAISFKVDASQNLKARVRRRCGFDLAVRFDSHTFHAFAKRILDRFRLALTGRDALDPDYSIGPARIQKRSITFRRHGSAGPDDYRDQRDCEERGSTNIQPCFPRRVSGLHEGAVQADHSLLLGYGSQARRGRRYQAKDHGLGWRAGRYLRDLRG
jgi:hypothetical protein